MTKEYLIRMKNCVPLLPEPGDKVALELITEIERLRQLLEERHYDFDNEEN